MSKGNTFENDVTSLVYHGVSIPGIADNAAVSPVTSFYASLHTGSLATIHAGDQTTTEVSYGGYARVPISRDALGFEIITGNFARINEEVAFPIKTSGADEVMQCIVIGTDATGPGKIIQVYLSGATVETRTLLNGRTPIIRADRLSFFEG